MIRYNFRFDSRGDMLAALDGVDYIFLDEIGSVVVYDGAGEVLSIDERFHANLYTEKAIPKAKRPATIPMPKNPVRVLAGEMDGG